jgi:hypothetical protein
MIIVVSISGFFFSFSNKIKKKKGFIFYFFVDLGGLGGLMTTRQK